MDSEVSETTSQVSSQAKLRTHCGQFAHAAKEMEKEDNSEPTITLVTHYTQVPFDDNEPEQK